MWKAALCLALWIGFVVLLNKPLSVGEISMPPLGRFFSPFDGFWMNAEGPDGPFKAREFMLEGLRDEVRIVLDERMVPHIFAKNDLDAWYAQGYITATFRLWQADISARATAGELSKIFGERLLEYDKSQRNLGMGYAAENAVKGWEKFPEGMSALNAYADGYNAYLNNLDPAAYPIEFKLINYSPEPWTPLKSALFAKSMATRLCMAEDDLEHTVLTDWLGEERFASLFPEHNPLESPIIPKGTTWPETHVDVPPSAYDAVHTAGTFPADTTEKLIEGSNNWAVSGSRTATGKPILCNDPHLGLSLPSVWFEIQIVTPNFNVYGVTLPGIPGVIIGFNEDIAWGITNTGYDVLDWYTISWKDPDHRVYALDDKAIPASYRIEEIEVKGKPTVYDTITYTQWGPVQKTGPHAGHAMRWLAHDIPDRNEMEVFIQLNKAMSYADFRSALSGFQTPAQNFVYADKEGNVAMQIAGKMPLRSDRMGRFVQDGSSTKNGWHGTLPFEANPAVLNPPRGFVSSANQESTDSTYPYIYMGLFEDFRGRILNRYLASMENVSPEDMEQLQYSNVSLKAEELLPVLLSAITDKPGGDADAHRLLSAWQYDYRTELEAPVLFELWYSAFTRLLYDDFRREQDSLYIRTPLGWRTNLLALQEPDSREFDIDSTESVETFGDIARLSYEEALSQYNALPETAKTWGGYRTTTVRHMANIPAFNREISTTGHADALNATTMTHGPSWRMVVSMTDPVEAFVVYPGGQSGNPGSPHYAEMIETWRAGRYYSAHILHAPDELGESLTLTLTPASK